MRLLFKMVVLLAVILLFTPSCSYLENLKLGLTDTSPPTWIELRDARITKSDLLHVLVNEAAIWEAGDDVKSWAVIWSKLQIEIDGHPLPDDKIYVLDTFDYPTYVYDNKGNIIGSHTGWTDVVFAPSVPPGVHTATLEITSTSGRVFTYTWEFEVPEATVTP